METQSKDNIKNGTCKKIIKNLLTRDQAERIIMEKQESQKHIIKKESRGNFGFFRPGIAIKETIR